MKFLKLLTRLAIGYAIYDKAQRNEEYNSVRPGIFSDGEEQCSAGMSSLNSSHQDYQFDLSSRTTLQYLNSKPLGMIPPKDTLQQLQLKKSITEALDQLSEIIDFRPQIAGVKNYQQLYSLLKKLRVLRKNNPEVHDSIVDSKGRYLVAKLPNWSDESFITMQIEKQNEIIRYAIAQYSDILLGTPKNKSVQEALLILLSSQTSLNYEEIYTRVYGYGGSKNYLKLFLEYVKKNRSIKALSFRGSEIGNEAACTVLTSLESHPTLEILDLSGHDMLKEGSKPTVLDFIKKNQILKELYTEHLSGGPLSFGKKDAREYEDALLINFSLISLQIVSRWNSDNEHLQTILQLLDRNKRSQTNSIKNNLDGTPYNRQALIGILSPFYQLDELTDIFTNHVNEPMLVNAKSQVTMLHIAAANNDIDTIKTLLDEGAAIDRETSRRWTALHYATAKGHVEATQLLLDRGAGVEKITQEGRTPAQHAIEFSKSKQDMESKRKFSEIQRIIELRIDSSRATPKETAEGVSSDLSKNKRQKIKINKEIHPSVSPVKFLIANSKLYRDQAVSESYEEVETAKNRVAPN